MKKKSIFIKIRKIVSKIPKRKVVTYGNIAKVVGLDDARVVGWALRGNQDPKIPCHRVVKKHGFLAKNYSLGGWQEQKRRLESDGVGFIGDNQVNFKKYHWKIGRF